MTEEGYLEATDTSFTLDCLPGNDSYFEEQFRDAHPVDLVSHQEHERRRLIAAEWGWLKYESYDPKFPTLAKVVGLFISGQIDQSECERYVLAHQLLQWDFGTINDD
ncbi:MULTISPECIES: hypothetical protein [unclassified Acidocella]|uniref:hypothetical protein n=1 Tax=unclassified Acidocella TaxID=2648610 RepID=UPI00196A0CA3|nr:MULTISPECIES: hypothetical protein [unclassified Acidocella]WBO61070.1 hypothetical protein GT370_10370 [Acidocella sp. MX-AZ03]